jgi:hypothetical protein
MPPAKMNDVRTNLLTDAYRKARLATIATASNIRHFFAPGDTAETIRAIMRRLYAIGQSQASVDNEDRLQREAVARASAAANVGNNNAEASSSTSAFTSARTTRADNRRRLVEAREFARANAIRRDNYNSIQMNAFLAGADAAHIEYEDPRTLAVTLRALASRIANNEMFIISQIDPTQRKRVFFTLSAQNFDDLVRSMNRDLDPEAEEFKSDVEFRHIVEKGGFATITRVPPRKTPGNAPWTNNAGAFCPFLHNYSCEHLTEVLANLGCWKVMLADNYKANCLYLAFQSAGVAKDVLEDLKTCVLRRTVSRSNIKYLALKHSLYVTIHTYEDKNLIRYGDSANFPVNLGLYREHYIHYYKTDICSYAINHHDQYELVDDFDGSTSMVDRWWMFRDATNRTPQRGMNSLDLLKLVDATTQNHVQQITLSTPGLLKTSFHNKYRNSEIECLEYPECVVKLVHDKRTPGTMEPCKPFDPEAICIYSAAIRILMKELEGHPSEAADVTKTLWKEKSTRLGLGLAEQVELLKKAMPIAAKIFLDTETHTDANGKHIVHTAVYQEENDISPRDFHGPDCVPRMLDEINRRFGMQEAEELATKKKRKKSETPSKAIPTVQLFAHNLSYDAAFIFPHLPRLKTLENATNIITASGLYHLTVKPGPNSCLLDWMHGEGNVRLKESYRRLNLNVDERRERHLAWNLAISGIRTHPIFLTRRNVTTSYIADVHGWVLDIVLQARFEDYEPLQCEHEYRKQRVVDFKLMDTYKMISKPLRDFGSAFGLDQEKEVMPYALFNSEFVSRQMIATCEEIKAVPNFNDFDKLMDNVHRWGCLRPDGLIDMQRYQSEYCKGDVAVLRAGYLKFRELCLEKYDLDCSWFLTISSMSNTLFTERGVYADVYQVSGAVLQFIKRCTVGGRTMCAENKQSVVTTDVQDLDGVSLYPSAMKRLGGYLKGRPKVIDDSTDLDKADGYFAQIRVLSVGRRFRLPIVRLPSETGSNNWTNEIEGETLYVDKITLEDLVEHAQIEYVVERGYYFDEGRNETVVGFIQEMFNERLEYKRLKNKPLSEILKLVMNVRSLPPQSYNHSIHSPPILTITMTAGGIWNMWTKTDRHFDPLPRRRPERQLCQKPLRVDPSICTDGKWDLALRDVRGDRFSLQSSAYRLRGLIDE